MRKFCEGILKKFFYNHLVHTRNDLAWTQAKMAKTLAMDERSYIDLDHGKTSCSGLTLVLYLAYCCDDPLKFIDDFKTVYEKELSIRQ
ncbi:MAG: hypothetical protein J6K84_05120 [Oscillospiraceae bacterium]|nr:hypothetical protein [Oscillospiraceae bacterium]